MKILMDMLAKKFVLLAMYIVFMIYKRIIVKVTQITKVDAPKDEFVYPPDGTYVPTSNYL